MNGYAVPVGNCKTCEAPIVWARSTAGKPMPLDAAPVVGGTFVLTRTLDGDFIAIAIHADDGKPRFVSHFSTCPDAARFRKPRATRPRGRK